MSKQYSNYPTRKLFCSFLSSAFQFILYGPVLVVLALFIPWPRKLWVILIVLYVLIPILSAFICCFLVHRKNFHFDSQNSASKVSVHRFSARMLSVLCFILIGYIFDKRNAVPMFISNLMDIFGEYSGTFESLLKNFLFYPIVAIFPITYAIVEFLFVSTKNDMVQTDKNRH